MPQLLNGTGAPQWGDVANHPWTTGMQLDYASEAGLWAEWLQTEHPDATTVAAVDVQQRLRQEPTSTGFEQLIEGTDIEVVEQQFHEPTAPDLTNQFTTMAAIGRRRRADRDDRHVLHPGDGRAREEHRRGTRS